MRFLRYLWEDWVLYYWHEWVLHYWDRVRDHFAERYRIRWTYVTRDKDWGHLIGDHPELHDLARPETVDLALDPNGDHVFIPTPDGGVAAVVVISHEHAHQLVDAYRTLEKANEDWDEDEDWPDEADEANELIDAWVEMFVERIDGALNESTNHRWERE